MRRSTFTGIIVALCAILLTAIVMFQVAKKEKELQPTPIPTKAPVWTITPTGTSTLTDTPESGTPTEGMTPTGMATPTEAATPTATVTPTNAATPTPTITFGPLTPTLAPGIAWESSVDISHLDPNKPMVALTFDDGPSKSSTTKILDILEQYNVRATFFYVGYNVKNYPDQIRRAYELGCEIANHTDGHLNLTKLSPEEVRAEAERVAEALRGIVPQDRFLVRCPGGSYNNMVKNSIDVPLIYWSVDTRDWSSRDANAVIEETFKNLRDGDIVLMHEIYASTADAVEVIVPRLIEEGWQLVTVSELMAAKGKTMESGVSYSSAR